MKFTSCVASVALLALSACSMGGDNPSSRIASNDASCAMNQELEAIDARALQSDLMNSALSCNQQPLYNAFVKKFNPQLKEKHTLVKGYFNRLHRGNSSRQMTTFMTGMANRASEKSMNMDGIQFCRQSAARFQKIMNESDIRKIADGSKYRWMHGLHSCNQRSI